MRCLAIEHFHGGLTSLEALEHKALDAKLAVPYDEAGAQRICDLVTGELGIVPVVVRSVDKISYRNSLGLYKCVGDEIIMKRGVAWTTLAHELAHHIVYCRYEDAELVRPRRKAPHGKEFKAAFAEAIPLVSYALAGNLNPGEPKECRHVGCGGHSV